MRPSGVVSVELEADKTTKYCAAARAETELELVQEFDAGPEETVKRSGRARCADCCRQFIAFLFSTVGSCCLMVGYVVLGGLVFRGLEADHERQTRTDMAELRQTHVRWLWNVTEKFNVLHPDDWSEVARRVFDSYTAHVSYHFFIVSVPLRVHKK